MYLSAHDQQSAIYTASYWHMPSGKEKPVEEDVKASAHTVEEQTITSRAGGYTASTGEGQKIVVMKIPGEDANMLHTHIHEISRARLDHLYKKLPRGIAESEAKLSTCTVGSHFGFDFEEDTSA